MSRGILHIALGDSAAGSLREACRNHGLPGSAQGIPDDLSHGPLDDGLARLDYMRACFRGYEDWHPGVTDAFAPWRDLVARIENEKIDTLVIWGGENVSETTFLAMSCWWLRHRPERMLRVPVSGAHGGHYTPMHMPSELADKFRSARELSDSQRTNLAVEFLRIRDETGLLRRWDEGRITDIPLDRYDPLLLESCSADWTTAARVIGSAMSRCDGHNLMSDLFFSCRLQRLIDDEQIEADGTRTRMRDYAVRLATP
ncbi:MAG: DUF3658 domain-containing protein [Gammaproteobacteria bacterium]